MSKFFQAFLTGLFFTFFLDFFLFLGIFEHYIRFYEIELYYNVLFADHQNIFIYLILTIIIGFLVTYVHNKKISLTMFIVLFLISLSFLIPSVGYSIGKLMLMTQKVTLKDAKYTYNGDIYYNGRNKITFYDKEIDKIIILNKKDLKNETYQ